MSFFRDKYGAMSLGVTVALLADQVSKSLIIHKLPVGGKLAVIPGCFEFFHTYNTGALFSLFTGHRVAFFLTANALAIVFLLYIFTRLARRDMLPALALSMILGGALGNSLDRIRHGSVVDFLRFYLGKFSWPTANVADIAIVCGVILFAVQMFQAERMKNMALEKQGQ